jgi:DNA polymerase (family 10)
MDNYAIADNFVLLSKLIDINGDDSFKAKSYSSAAFAIEKLPVQLSSLPAEKIYTIKSVGLAIGKKIVEQINTGKLGALDEYIQKTPAGIFDLLKIKGLGPKKIHTVWKELGIESMGELLYACEENRLLLYKGFGAKTQQNIEESIRFFMASLGSYLYSQIEQYAFAFTQKIQKSFPSNQFLITGDFNRNAEVIHTLEWITDVSLSLLEASFIEQDYQTNVTDAVLSLRGPENVALTFYYTTADLLINQSFVNNCSPAFFAAFEEKYGWNNEAHYAGEAQIFKQHNLQYIPPFLRENPQTLLLSAAHALPDVVTQKDIRGIIHTHSDWSDGRDTIEAMAQGAIQQGFEYLVISDHSQSAYYAKGLYPDRIKAQHVLIDELNEKYKPFKIFKSIESDILNDGSLDYPNNLLSAFDLVITSVHANLKMSEDKAMSRLLKAIANPYTAILGHMTGRLLLSRNGYPVNHEQIIDACAKYNVAIELNAHSRRLDMDWRHIPYAIQKGVLISIDPDAHTIEGFRDIRYGVLAAQKGGLTSAHNVSSFTLNEFEAFLEKQREKRYNAH